MTTPAIPFATTTPWLVQIGADYLAAAAGDAAKAKQIRDSAVMTDAEWNAAHPSPTPGAFDYARTAYRTAYAALQALGMFATAPSAAPVSGAPTTPPVTGTPTMPTNGAAWKKWALVLVGVIAVIWLLRKLS
jgi:hypothetical protein